jgi:YVTN family beta-propeller protein
MRWIGNTRPLTIAFALAWGLTLQSETLYARDELGFEIEAKIPLGEISGRIDHLAYDPGRQRLYVAELGSNSVGIVDLKTRRLIRTAPGFDEPQGVAYEAFKDIVYVASSGDGSLRLFRGADFAPLGKISLGDDADNVRIESATHRVYVGYGNGAIAVVDATSRKRLADFPLEGHPESFQLEANGPRLFVNVPGAGMIQVASRDTGKVIASWPMENLRANYPMAMDEPNNHLLAVFRQPARLAAFDTRTGAAVGETEACGDADDVFIDPKRGRVYVVCGQGTVDTFVANGKAFARAARFETSQGSRTGLYLADIDRLVVAIRASGTEPASIWLLRPNP